MNYTIRKGLDLPILGGSAEPEIKKVTTKQVALIGEDYPGMKPTMQVKEGEVVKAGQTVFSCKKNIGLTFTAPVSGKVVAINRGARRAFQSMVIERDEHQTHVDFKSYINKSVTDYSADEVKALLLESGQWTSLRQRPFEKVASVNGIAADLFITATDTQPLAPNPNHIIGMAKDDFLKGIQVLSKLTSGKTYVCTNGQLDLDFGSVANAQVVTFGGKHPAGNVGTHIHFLSPVNMERNVWHVGYQDVISIGRLFQTGKVSVEKFYLLAGPNVKTPYLLHTERGAQISEMVSGNIVEKSRIISGSVLNGRTATDSFDFATHFTNQISVIEEDDFRELLGWKRPGLGKFSTKNVYVGKFLKKAFNLGSSTHGSPRAMVPIGMFENIMPLDILPTQLLRALVSKDLELAQDLGCLELAEEDLALCTFVSPGKVDFGPVLRETLDIIEREG